MPGLTDAAFLAFTMMPGMKSVPIKALELDWLLRVLEGAGEGSGERLVQISVSERRDTGQHLR